MTGRANGRLAVFIGVLVVVAGGSTSFGQCREGLLNNEEVQEALFLDTPILDKIATSDERPAQTPTVTQVAATADAAASPSPVSRPELPDVLALAFGQNAIKGENGALTFDLNAFGLKALGDPGILDSPSEYLRYSRLRRLGMAVSLGGKGLAVDADGDGEAEAAKEAESATDIVSYEARWQFWGTRDPLDKRSFDRVLAKANTSLSAVDKAVESLRTALTAHLNEDGVAAEFFPDSLGCMDAERLDRFLRSEEIQPLQERLGAADREVLSVIDAAIDEVKHSPVWTLFAGGTERADGFGANERQAGIRGAFGETGHSWVVNLAWKQLEGLSGGSDPTTWTVGGEWIRQWRGLATPVDQFAQVSASLSGERFEDVPTAELDEVLKATLRLDYPIWEKVTLPISLTWANHASLIDEDDALTAHIGLSVDFKELLKPSNQ